MQWRLPLNEMHYLVRRNIQNDVVCKESQGQPIYGAVFTNYVLFEPTARSTAFIQANWDPLDHNATVMYRDGFTPPTVPAGSWT